MVLTLATKIPVLQMKRQIVISAFVVVVVVVIAFPFQGFSEGCTL